MKNNLKLLQSQGSYFARETFKSLTLKITRVQEKKFFQKAAQKHTPFRTFTVDPECFCKLFLQTYHHTSSWPLTLDSYTHPLVFFTLVRWVSCKASQIRFQILTFCLCKELHTVHKKVYRWQCLHILSLTTSILSTSTTLCPVPSIYKTSKLAKFMHLMVL